MYIPKHFDVSDQNELLSFIAANSFGQFISKVDERPFCTHLPFLLSEDKEKLIGHLAIHNPQHLELEGQEVLVIFQGEHAFISPSWYAAPGVPTWNYQAAHVYGRASLFNSTERLKRVVESLTLKYESAFNPPWVPEFNPSLLNAIVGVEITISDIQGKYKLSQNRSEQDRLEVANRLNGLGYEKLAVAMKSTLDPQ